MEPPWKAYNIMQKMDYPYEASTISLSFAHDTLVITLKGLASLSWDLGSFLQHIFHSMKDPSIAAFWLFTMPKIIGGIEYDDEVKQKIWWQYKVCVVGLVFLYWISNDL